MKTSHLMAAAAIISATSIAPASAAFDRIGSVNIDYRSDRDVESFRFGGPVERLQFRAERSNVNCSAIQVTFANGRTQRIYTGNLVQNRDVNVDLPGDARNLRSLRFTCGAANRNGGTIRVSAEIGGYQDEWRRNPEWNQLWSRFFNWGTPQNRPATWQPLSNVRFQDTNVPFTNARGRGVEAVALMPVDANARCSRVSVRFANGRTANLNINNGAVMRRGQSYTLDLPGNDRNLRDMDLQCQSEGNGAVTIRVLTR